MRHNWSRPARQAITPGVPSPTIEVKPTIVVNPPPKERRPWWQIVGIIVAGIVPIMISAIALAFSILGYRDQLGANSEQTKANSVAVLTTEQEAADHVSFWFTSDRNPVLIIQNLGNSPAYKMVVTLHTYVTFKTSGRRSQQSFTTMITLPLDTLPPCSKVSFPLLGSQSLGDTARDHLYFTGQVAENMSLGDLVTELAIPTEIVFTDVNGLTWSRSAQGVLRPRSVPALNDSSTFGQSTYPAQAVTGCS